MTKVKTKKCQQIMNSRSSCSYFRKTIPESVGRCCGTSFFGCMSLTNVYLWSVVFPSSCVREIYLREKQVHTKPGIMWYRMGWRIAGRKRTTATKIGRPDNIVIIIVARREPGGKRTRVIIIIIQQIAGRKIIMKLNIYSMSNTNVKFHIA